ncbi:hypothetical protein KCU81_g3933, partial [Aureobasidium melanogenum]|uniref:DUF6604 domain-containing protein n=1 Tax=Aureobasidium melanogenum (strain CBS 110374) TaxID=1043003 RepID=A0A074VPT0_AURM1
MARNLNGSLRVPYLNYKKDTRYILWRLAHASNSIITTIPHSQRISTDVINTTGHMTCAEIEIMSQRVGAAFLKRREQVPSIILYLFDSVIKGRQNMSEEYKAMYTGIQDEEFERSNDRHQAFINTLTFAFKALGGNQWLLTLQVHASDDDPGETTISVEVPLRDYRVVDGPDDKRDRAIMILTAFVEDLRLRNELQSWWGAVAHNQSTISVAGVMSNTAIALVKRTAAALFVESDAKGEHSDSYISLLNDIANGGPADLGHTWFAKYGKRFGIYIYNALVEFVTDYQKNRNGRPTKRLRAQLVKWIPGCNLQQLSERGRLEWLRLYTINWLYDLVNVFVHIVRQERHIDKAFPKDFTWFVDGPYRRNARLFGIEDFAACVTTWSMQKPGTAFQHKILLHHVFQLQCIVDSFAATQGWFSVREDKDEFRPCPKDFRPAQAIDRFLDRHTDGHTVGFIRGVDAFLETVKSMPSRSGVSHMDNLLEELQHLPTLFNSWLGTSNRTFDLDDGPESRFERCYNSAESSRNGLWEHSPFLCGVGLAEALNVAYRIGLVIWDELRELSQLMQVHYILVEKGFLSQALDRFNDLVVIFHSRAFWDPTTDRLGKNKRYTKPTQPQARALSVSSTTLKDWLNLEENALLHSKHTLLLLQEFDWNFWRVPEDQVNPTTTLGSLYLTQTRRTTDSETGNVRFENTEFIRNARRLFSLPTDNDDHLLGVAESLEKRFLPAMRKFQEEYDLPASEDSHKDISSCAQGFETLSDTDYAFSTFHVWSLLEIDVKSEICGRSPPFGFNYLWFAAILLKTWTRIDDCLAKIQSPIYNVIQNTGHLSSRRDNLIRQIRYGSSEDDTKCAAAIAKILQQVPMFRRNCTYWDGYYCLRCETKHDTYEDCTKKLDQ